MRRHKCTVKEFRAEVAAMTEMAGDGVVKILGSFTDGDERCIVMELAEGGDLFGLVRRRVKLPEAEVRRFFGQVVACVQAVHDRGWVHGDIKLENVVLTTCGDQAKLTDCGFSSLQKATGLCRPPRGTAHYASPELVLGQGYCGKASDLYACGVVLYSMLSGRYPFAARPDCGLGGGDPLSEGILRHFRDESTLDRLKIPAGCPEGATCLIRRLLDPDPCLRATMAEVLVDPWLRGTSHVQPCDAPACTPPCGLPLCDEASNIAGKFYSI
jgi:serine/threonine-protein kinase HSL1 (negative regulator of Swe1 kinase)